MRGKELELEQAAEAYRNLQWLKQQSEEKERNTLREKDTIISQLQAALQTRSQETQVTHTFMPLFVMAYNCLLIVSFSKLWKKTVKVDKPVLLVLPCTNATGVLTQPFLGEFYFVCVHRI